MERVTEHREAPALAVYGWRGGFFVVLRGLLIPEAQCYFRAIVPAFAAAVNLHVYDPVEAGKIVVHIVGVFGGDIPDLVAVDIDTESGLAFPFFPLQSQFHCSLVERFVFEVDFSQDGLTAFAPVLEGNARNIHGKKFKSGLCFTCSRRGKQRSGGSWPDSRRDTIRRTFLAWRKAAFLCDRKRDILRFSHSGTMRVCVIPCTALFKIDLCFLCRVHSRAPFNSSFRVLKLWQQGKNTFCILTFNTIMQEFCVKVKKSADV